MGDIVAQRPFKLGRIGRKVSARAQPPKKVCTCQSHKHASQNKKPVAKCRRKVVAGSDPWRNKPFGVGDWLSDKDILCWLNQELYHMEIYEPHVWTLVVAYIKRVSKWMQIIECGSTLDGMAWCRDHIFVVNSDDKEGLQWFVCAFDCGARLECFIIWVWEPLSSISLICPFLSPLSKHHLTTKQRALGFQKDGWSCGFKSPHGGSPRFFLRCFLTPMGPSFADDMLSIVNADCFVLVIQPPVDDLEGALLPFCAPP